MPTVSSKYFTYTVTTVSNKYLTIVHLNILHSNTKEGVGFPNNYERIKQP